MREFVLGLPVDPPPHGPRCLPRLALSIPAPSIEARDSLGQSSGITPVPNPTGMSQFSSERFASRYNVYVYYYYYYCRNF